MCYLIYVSTRREVRYYLFFYIFFFNMHGKSLPEVCKLAMVIQLVKCGFRIQKRQVSMHKDDLGSSLGSPKAYLPENLSLFVIASEIVTFRRIKPLEKSNNQHCWIWCPCRASLEAQLVTSPPAMLETLVQFLGREVCLKKGIGYPLQYSWAPM